MFVTQHDNGRTAGWDEISEVHRVLSELDTDDPDPAIPLVARRHDHKQRAIDKTKPLAAKPGRYRPPDSLLAFLEAL